ncbi:unnamed protein product, partial [Ectocarpus sp. 13 AM-2016]
MKECVSKIQKSVYSSTAIQQPVACCLSVACLSDCLVLWLSYSLGLCPTQTNTRTVPQFEQNKREVWHCAAPPSLWHTPAVTAAAAVCGATKSRNTTHFKSKWHTRLYRCAYASISHYTIHLRIRVVETLDGLPAGGHYGQA